MGIGWSMHRNGAWLGQLARVRRWHERLTAAAARQEAYDEDEVLDFAFAFFQNCFALREWVQQTSTIPKTELDLFMSRTDMQACRDLANGTKHLNISRPSVDATFSIGREYDLVKRGTSGYRLFVIAGSEKYDLLDLALQCLSGWEALLGPHADNVKDASPAFLAQKRGA